MVDIYENKLGGEIPDELGDCVALLLLRVGGNFSHGSIPQPIILLRGIEVLDILSNNYFQEIPEFLAVFHSVKVPNLSCNNFITPQIHTQNLGNNRPSFAYRLNKAFH